MEGHNWRPADDEATEQARRPGEWPGPSDSARAQLPTAAAEDEEVRDVQGQDERAGVEPVIRDGEKGGVAEPGRAEPAGGGVHKEGQRRDEAAEARVAQPLQADDQQIRRWLLVGRKTEE